MKKITIILILILFFGYIVYQNGAIWMLKLLSLSSGSAQIKSTTTSGQNPPYKDGTYTGVAADAFYGNIQIQAVISGGKITDVQFLQYPNDRSRSIAINTLAMPTLKQEALQVQHAQVDIVSGATDSSQAFIQSLASALSQAK